MVGAIKARGLILQETPLVYVAVIPGKWLLKHTTPSWRIKDPEKGFQRVVKQERAEAIAAAVLDQGRTFPNSVILATDADSFQLTKDELSLPPKAKFLVVDGQHRLWAQNFSKYEAHYACLLHMGLDEVQMAKLFLEINDNQKRVPSSLRWDLVRLVKPADDPFALAASELVFELATDEKSPLYQRIDLTGESLIPLKQGSLAPEIKNLVSSKSFQLRDKSFDVQYDVLVRYFAAIQSLDSTGWKNGKSNFYATRVVRALLKLLPDIVKHAKGSIEAISTEDYYSYLKNIKPKTLDQKEIKAIQGSAGVAEILAILKQQVF